MILAARIFLVIFSTLMLSAPFTHAAAPATPGIVDVQSLEHCQVEQAECADLETADGHTADHRQMSSCCAMSCHAAVQPCFDHSTFLSVVRTIQVPGLSRNLTASSVTSLERPPRL